MDCARRQAGSIVSTQTLRPRWAARRASAAAVVVLPTPPEPQHTMTPTPRSSSRASMSARCCAHPGSPCSVIASDNPYSAARSIPPGSRGSSRMGWSVWARRRRSLFCRAARAAWSAASSASARSVAAVGSMVAARSPSSERFLEARSAASRSSRHRAEPRTWLMTTAPSGRPAAQVRQAVERLLHRHLLQQGDQVHGGARRTDDAHHRIQPGCGSVRPSRARRSRCSR